MADRILIAAAQINCTVGDLAGNAARILEFTARARAAGADLVLTPELSLCGYPPEDLLLRDGFLADCRRELERLAPRVQGTALVVGFPELAPDGRRYNAAALIRDGRIAAVARKHDLPNYEVFDEKRYFAAGERALRLRGEGRALRPDHLRGRVDPACPGDGQGGGRAGHPVDQRLALSQAQAGRRGSRCSASGSATPACRWST